MSQIWVLTLWKNKVWWYPNPAKTF